MKVKLLSRVQLLATPWTVAFQAPPFMGFSRQEYWSGVPLPSLVTAPSPHLFPVTYYCEIEWFALETNRDRSVVFEIASKYCISDSFVDHDGYSISSEGFLPAVVDVMVI